MSQRKGKEVLGLDGSGNGASSFQLCYMVQQIQIMSISGVLGPSYRSEHLWVKGERRRTAKEVREVRKQGVRGVNPGICLAALGDRPQEPSS